jgi:hypothetical protein
MANEEQRPTKDLLILTVFAATHNRHTTAHESAEDLLE